MYQIYYLREAGYVIASVCPSICWFVCPWTELQYAKKSAEHLTFDVSLRNYHVVMTFKLTVCAHQNY